MKWVKSTERPPDKKRVIIKNKGNANIIYNHNGQWSFDDYEGMIVLQEDWDNIEWLDESEPTIITHKDKAGEGLSWVTLNDIATALKTVSFVNDMGEELVYSTEVIKALSGFTAAHKEGSGWVSVRDSLPKNDGYSNIYCLCFDDYHKQIRVLSFNEYHNCWDDKSVDDYYIDAIGGKVTHWQPLPSPPKQ